ncbi:MAG: hypothetical protein CM1200mP2_10410 [Planctomycetaceae bacterium]|nr:MAG: hypothetical protein CM1200mP2_10410 [Planctomycetaceae bacterium]
MLVAVAMLVSVSASSLFAAEGDGHLDIYFIDVEGGACTLFVSPSGSRWSSIRAIRTTTAAI